MKAFTIQLRKDAHSEEEYLILNYVELVQREGKEGLFPVIPLGTVSKRPDEMEVTHLPDKFLKVNIFSRKGHPIETPAYIEQIQISTMDDRGRRFGLWDPRFRIDDPDAPAFIYLGLTEPEARTRFSTASDLMYEGLLTEGYNYHPERTVNKKGIAGFMFSCPSFLIAEKDQKYSIDHFDLKDQCRKVFTIHFDGNDIVVDHIERYEPVKPKKPEEEAPVQFQYVNSIQALKEEARKRREFIEKKKRDQAKAKRAAEKRTCYTTSSKDSGDGTLAGALKAVGLNITPDPVPEPEVQEEPQTVEATTEQVVQEEVIDTQEQVQEESVADETSASN